ncbi:hypothetical protein F966_04099 [Acinetobacter higginsii]|uniref:Uncharacterized protein n=1 Tax=Acinetobacter higginsii TaxID=70347 RepID=N8W8C4_9GAMM|nr:hypothetical protein F966_04099 [Acinetobacter higginsii]
MQFKSLDRIECVGGEVNLVFTSTVIVVLKN